MWAVLALLLASAVAGEWVEISQYQHRQPPSHRTSLDDATAANKVYANYSATERSWHRSGLTKVPNLGSVKRVQLQTKEKDMFDGVLSKKSENRRYENFGPVRAPNINLKENVEFTNGNIKSNLEDVKRDNFGKNNNKSENRNPFLNFNVETETLSSEQNEFQKHAQIIEKSRFHEIRLTHNRDHKTNNQKAKHTQSGSDDGVTVQVKKNKEDDKYFTDSEKDNSNLSERIRNNKETFRTANKTLNENIPHVHNSLKPVTQNLDMNRFDKNTDDRIKKESVTISEHKIDSKTDHRIQNNVNNDIHNKENDDTSKTNPVEVIWKLMKVVTDNISRNTRRSFRSKVRYLESLRNNILMNVEERIEQAWPDDTAPGAEGVRSKRAARGHVEFPTSESALMTISFLTFAVFLIKLVLQVIHTYKSKTMMVTPAVVAAVGRAAAALKGLN